MKSSSIVPTSYPYGLLGNLGINSNTTTENQLNLYNDLKQIDGLLPYIQDWSEGDNIQKSLAVILLDKSLEPKVIELAKKHHIEIDLINSVDDKKVDDIICGRLENLV